MPRRGLGLWKKRGLVFSVRDHGEAWMRGYAMLPTPLLKEDVIRVYFTTRDESGMSRMTFVDVDRTQPTRIVRVQKEPILELGSPGTFDDSGTLTNFAMPWREKVRLYYHGYNRRVVVPWSNAVGVAESDDGGETFSKCFCGPIIDRTRDEPYFAVGPWILEEEGKLRMWYSSGVGWVKGSGEALDAVYVIKYGESVDGIEWRRDNVTCIEPSHPDEANTRATVIESGGRYRMWFCYRGSRDFRDGSDAYRIGYAESEDGICWQRDDAAAGISLGDAGSWDSTMQAYPAVLRVDRSLVMFYNGNGFGIDGFGCAELEL